MRAKEKKQMQIPNFLKTEQELVTLLSYPTISKYSLLTDFASWLRVQAPEWSETSSYLILGTIFYLMELEKSYSKYNLVKIVDKYFDADIFDTEKLKDFLLKFVIKETPILLFPPNNQEVFTTFTPVLSYKNGKFIWGDGDNIKRLHANTFYQAFSIALYLYFFHRNNEILQTIAKATSTFSQLITDRYLLHRLVEVSDMNNADIFSIDGKLIGTFFAHREYYGYVVRGKEFAYLVPTGQVDDLCYLLMAGLAKQTLSEDEKESSGASLFFDYSILQKYPGANYDLLDIFSPELSLTRCQVQKSICDKKQNGQLKLVLSDNGECTICINRDTGLRVDIHAQVDKSKSFYKNGHVKLYNNNLLSSEKTLPVGSLFSLYFFVIDYFFSDNTA